VASRDNWMVATGEAPLEATSIALDDLSVWVDPRAEWRQMYWEAWRIQRDWFYDANLHGLDYRRVTGLYAPFVEGIGSRQDLNTLFLEMTGHIGVSHILIDEYANPQAPEAGVGLLGADFELVEGRWRIKKILRGEFWNPELIAPLNMPGVDVHEGEFLIAVNGQQVVGDAEVYRAFDGLAGKRTILTVGARADGAHSRDLAVIPVASEEELRFRSWIDGNRRKVNEMSDGKLAYVYLPDTDAQGRANFNRYYYAQTDREGAIIDNRFNFGGFLADSIIDQLKRKPQLVIATREGKDMVEPSGIFGPKVMISRLCSVRQGSARSSALARGADLSDPT
jgi:tricorn protease